jgi:hypothetical protein
MTFAPMCLAIWVAANVDAAACGMNEDRFVWLQFAHDDHELPSGEVVYRDVLVGQKKAIAIAVRNVSGRRRWSKLDEWLRLGVWHCHVWTSAPGDRQEVGGGSPSR